MISAIHSASIDTKVDSLKKVVADVHIRETEREKPVTGLAAVPRPRPKQRYTGVPVTALVFVCCFLELFSLMSMRSTLALYIGSIGGSPFDVGILTSILTVSSLLARPSVGHVIDIRGPKPLFVCAGIVTASGAIGHTLVSSFSGAVALVMAIGIAHASLMTAAVSLFLGQSKGPEEDASMLNLSGLNVVLVTAVAPGVALGILDKHGLPALHYALASLGLVGLCVFWAISAALRTSVGVVHTERPPLNWRAVFSREFLTACIAYMTWAVTSGAMMTFLPLYGRYRGVSNVGIFFTAYAVVNLAIRWHIPRLMQKLGRTRLLLIAFTCVTLGTLGLCQFRELKDLMIPAILYGLGTAAIYTPLASQVIDCMPVAYRMTGMGIFMSNVEIGQGLGAVALGIASRSMSYPQMFAVIAVAPIVGMVAVLVGNPTTRCKLGNLGG